MPMAIKVALALCLAFIASREAAADWVIATNTDTWTKKTETYAMCMSSDGDKAIYMPSGDAFIILETREDINALIVRPRSGLIRVDSGDASPVVSASPRLVGGKVGSIEELYNGGELQFRLDLKDGSRKVVSFDLRGFKEAASKLNPK